MIVIVTVRIIKSGTNTARAIPIELFCGETVGVGVLIVGTEDDVDRKVPTNNGCVTNGDFRLCDAVCNCTEDGVDSADVFVCASIIDSLYCRHSG